ncbi:hypothetical protein OXX79_012122 [Metschnikowia pulcherrima]
MTGDNVDFHPVELTAHFLLSGPLDNLHDNFSSLHESQKILLTRLHLIETRLSRISEDLDSSNFDTTDIQTRVKTLWNKLSDCASSTSKLDKRVEILEKRGES